MILLCYLFSITWLDLIEGLQSISSVVFNWLSEFWDTTKQQFSSYREDRKKYKADQSKQKASRSKATKKSKQSGEDQDSSENNNRIKPKQVDTDDEDVVIVGPSASASKGNQPAEIEQTSLEIGTQAKDRKSTRLNSSHVSISYAVFCLKKKRVLSRRFLCGRK